MTPKAWKPKTAVAWTPKSATPADGPVDAEVTSPEILKRQAKEARIVSRVSPIVSTLTGGRIPVAGSAGTSTVLDALPAVGGAGAGMVGEAFGRPAAVGAASLGGALGESLRRMGRTMLLEEPAGSVSGNLKAIGTSAAEQGGSELAGGVIGKAAGAAGHAIMQGAIRPTMRMANEFGDVVATALRERIPVGRIVGRLGSQTARRARGLSGEGLQRLLMNAEASGHMIPRADVSAPAGDLVDEISHWPTGQNAAFDRLTALDDEFMHNFPDQMTPTEVNKLTRAAQKKSRTVYSAKAAGGLPEDVQSLDPRFTERIATGGRRALEAIPESVAGGSIGATQRRTQSLIGLTGALRRAEHLRPNPMAEFAIPAMAAGGGAFTGENPGEQAQRGLEGFLLARALMSPSVGSRMALGLTDPMLQLLLRQAPRAFDYAYAPFDSTRH